MLGKVLRYTVLAAMCVAATGCQSATSYGECVGVAEDEDPTLHYSVSVRNVVLAVVFVETLFVPLIVVLSELSCPVGRQ